MRLTSFSVSNYRSIIEPSRITLRETLTTLIGPNNEGKSNVLRGLVTGLQVLGGIQDAPVSATGLLPRSLLRGHYDWSVDFPVAKQLAKPDGKSVFDLDFMLAPDEIAEFQSEVRSKTNGVLPITLALGATSIKFTVRKQGKGGIALSSKRQEIASFVSKRIDIQYIPAVRPASEANDVIDELVRRALAVLADDNEYKATLTKLEELEQPVLNALSTTVRDTLRVFLPRVKSVRLSLPRRTRGRTIARSCEVVVDDGAPTLLEQKGDGVQSIAAISLIQHLGAATGKQSILAIEEPESHLHPRAIHQLREVLSETSKQHQVVLTTHCPIFVDRADISSCFVVTGNSAQRATSVKQIRDLLGIRVSDNLTSAEVVFVVEGPNDETAMRALLAHHSEPLTRAIRDGRLAFDVLGGGDKLGYKAGLLNDAMYEVFVLLDNDKTGRGATDAATKGGKLSPTNVFHTTVVGMANSDLEDWFEPSVYAPILETEFGVLSSSPLYRSTYKKWCDRMADVFAESGKSWNNGIEMLAKLRLAECAKGRPSEILDVTRKSAFLNIVARLESAVARSIARS